MQSPIQLMLQLEKSTCVSLRQSRVVRRLELLSQGRNQALRVIPSLLQNKKACATRCGIPKVWDMEWTRL